MNLFTTIEQVIRSNPKYVSKDGTVLRNLVFEDSMKMDSDLIDLLLTNESIKSHFFTLTKNSVLVFDKIKFGWAINNKQFLQDSYTRYEKKIGLSNDGENYLVSSGNIELIFPHKDCILEGGQTKEDQKHEEIFYNETLAPNDVDKLLAPKVFVGAKKYDKEHLDGILTTSYDEGDNLVIKGNNLLVISSLLKRFTNRVKLIYIDVPYNTGNDSFGYNDRFNHSTWLCFMKNRLRIAHQLLKKDGTIALSVDNYEIGYLLVLMDEVFGKENRKNIITVRRASVSGPKVINPGVVNIIEYIIIYSKDTTVWRPNRVVASREYNDRYSTFIENIEDNYTEWRFKTVLEALADSLGIPKRQLKPRLGENFDRIMNDFVIEHRDQVIRLASLDEGSVGSDVIEYKRKSIENPDKIFHMPREDSNDYYIKNGNVILFAKDRIALIDGKLTFTESVSDLWTDVLPNDLHNEGGVKFKKGKKPEKLVGRLIELCTNEGELVLDFFAGSGTTGGAALKMNRQFIIVDQMDYTETITRQRIINTINGDSHGISKNYNWHGGGSFIYTELAMLNQAFVKRIQDSKSLEENISLLNDILLTGFVSCKVDLCQIINNIDDFKALDFQQQKQVLMQLLDKNMLYVNLEDMDDEEFNITENDKHFTLSFYKK